MKQIKYIKKKTKYRVEEDYYVMTGIVGYSGETPLLKITPIGKLIIRYGYGFDPSGPTIDTKSAIRGSAVHDALSEFVRLGIIPASELDKINDELKIKCKEDGMLEVRAEAWDYFLDMIGGSFTDTPDEVLTAP